MVTQPAVFRDGQHVTITTPYLNGQSVVPIGTSAATEPVITIADGPAVNTWGNLVSAGYGEILLAPYNNRLVIENGIHLQGGHITMGTIDGGSVTLDGTSTITGGSSLTEGGGRYQADPTIINGGIYVGNDGASPDHSFVDFSHTRLQGAGSIHADGIGSIVEVNAVVAGLNLYVNKGAELVFAHNNGGKMLGTIHEAAGGDTFVGNVATAAKEIFHRSTGELDIVDKFGKDLASLKFSGATSLYATPAFGGVDITTTHQSHSLPAIFTH